MQIPQIAIDRVKAGAMFLDRTLSDTNWRKKINHKTLNLASYSDCILGQLFDSYYNGTRTLNLLYTEDRIRLGFTSNCIDDYNSIDLTKAWKQYLCNSQSARALQSVLL